MLRTLLITLLAVALAVPADAQTDDEYLFESGVGVGTVSYLGDFNGSLLRDVRPMATVMLRRVINPYMAVRLACGVGTLHGSSKDVDTYYPELDGQPYSFSNTMTDVNLTYEYNFWPYGTGKDYRGARRFTPFLMLGIGGTYVKADKSVFTANAPLGIGLKYKAVKRLNIGLEWAVHFTLSDKLDGVKDPYTIKSKGIFKNTDCYSALQLTVTYSFKPKCITCNNDE